MSANATGPDTGRHWPVFIAALCALLPVLSATFSYLVSAGLMQVPWCLPLLDGCTSISRAARSEPALFFFRLLMLPEALLLIQCWLLTVGWLRLRGSSATALRLVLLSGCVGAMALAIYVDFLGSNGAVYQFMRRFGITFYFAGTGLAQLITVRELLKPDASPTGMVRWLWYLVFGQLLLAMLHVLLKFSLADYDHWENRIEWSVALLMTCWFAVLAKLWRREHVGMQLTGRKN